MLTPDEKNIQRTLVEQEKLLVDKARDGNYRGMIFCCISTLLVIKKKIDINKIER
jgi:hypothetical protein